MRHPSRPARSVIAASSSDLPIPAGPENPHHLCPAEHRLVESPLEDRQLRLPPDRSQGGVTRCGVVLEQLVAQADGLAAGVEAQLVAQHPVEAVELTEGCIAVTGRYVPAHQREVGQLVAGVDRDDLRPSLEQSEQADEEAAQVLACRQGPVLVGVFREELAAVPVGRCGPERGIAAGHRGRGVASKAIASTTTGTSGKSWTRSPPQHDGVGATGGLAGVVGGLVQLRRSRWSIGSSGQIRSRTCSRWSRRSGRSREQLDERGGVPSAPGGVRNGAVADRDREAAEQIDADRFVRVHLEFASPVTHGPTTDLLRAFPDCDDRLRPAEGRRSPCSHDRSSGHRPGGRPSHEASPTGSKR